MTSIPTEPHSILRHGDFVTSFPEPLGSIPSPPWLLELFRLEAEVPLARDEETRGKIRDLLRHGGYKPTGRGKPSSEYLVRAAGEGTLESINLAVDVGNAVSLHSALPVSVIDLDRATQPLRIALGAKDTEYIFNASGQSIDVEGLLCLHDALGPCANAVKDAQRTKTGPETRRTLTIVWAAAGLEDRLERALAWYREILVRAGVPMP